MTSFCPPPAAWSQRPAHLRGYPLAALANTIIPCRQPLLSSLTLGQPGHKHRLVLTLQSSFYLSFLSVEMTLVRHPPSLRRPRARTADDDLVSLTEGCSSKVRACILKSLPSLSSIPPISPRSFFWMIGISGSANLFYCFCLHLPKGDYNQGHGQEPHPHLLKSRLGGSPSRPLPAFLFSYLVNSFTA